MLYLSTLRDLQLCQKSTQLQIGDTVLYEPMITQDRLDWPGGLAYGVRQMFGKEAGPEVGAFGDHFAGLEAVTGREPVSSLRTGIATKVGKWTIHVGVTQY